MLSAVRCHHSEDRGNKSSERGKGSLGRKCQYSPPTTYDAAPFHSFGFVQDAVPPGFQWASRGTSEMKISGWNTDSTLPDSWSQSHTDTDPLPPPLSILDCPHAQLTPPLVSVTHLVAECRPSMLRDMSFWSPCPSQARAVALDPLT